MAKINFQCPECGHGLAVAAEKAGKKARCPRCSNILTIPSGAAAPPQPATATVPTPSPTPPPPPPPPAAVDDEDDGKAYTLVDAAPPMTDEDRKKKEKERKKEEQRLFAKLEEAISEDKLKKAEELLTRLNELDEEAKKQAKEDTKPDEDELEKRRLLVGLKKALNASDVDTAAEFAERLTELGEDDEEEEEEGEEFDETGKRILKKKKEEAPRIKVPRRNLASLRKAPTHPEKWNMVRLGTLLVAISVMIWLTAYLLRCLVFLIGAAGPSEYAYIASTELVDLDAPSRPGVFLPLRPAPFLIGLIGGTEYFTVCLWMMRIAYSLTLVQLLVACVGYGLCLKTPPESGMRGLLITCCCLALINFVCVLVWRLLPVTGAMDYTLIQYVMPEVAILDANIDRIDAIHITWSSAIFWESFFAIFMHLLIYLEPVLFCLALRYAGMTLKDEPVRRDAEGLIELGLGCAFMVLAFQLLINCGTTEVLVNVLRAVYILFLCFFAGQLIWYVIYLFQARRRIYKALKV